MNGTATINDFIDAEFLPWGDTYMTSALRGAEGGSGNADEVREVAWIYSMNSLLKVDRGEGEGVQKPENCADVI